MGTKCCNDNRLYNIYDTINFIENEENWLRESIDFSNKEIKNDSDVM